MSEWRSIKNAPKDGSHILLAFGVGGITVGWWDPEFEWARNIRRGAWTDGTVASWGYEETNKIDAHHWMPLPAPPVSDSMHRRSGGW